MEEEGIADEELYSPARKQVHVNEWEVINEGENEEEEEEKRAGIQAEQTDSDVDSADVADEMDETSAGNEGRISLGAPHSPAFDIKRSMT